MDFNTVESVVISRGAQEDGAPLLKILFVLGEVQLPEIFCTHLDF